MIKLSSINYILWMEVEDSVKWNIDKSVMSSAWVSVRDSALSVTLDARNFIIRTLHIKWELGL